MPVQHPPIAIRISWFGNLFQETQHLKKSLCFSFSCGIGHLRIVRYSKTFSQSFSFLLLMTVSQMIEWESISYIPFYLHSALAQLSIFWHQCKRNSSRSYAVAHNECLIEWFSASKYLYSRKCNWPDESTLYCRHQSCVLKVDPPGYRARHLRRQRTRCQLKMMSHCRWLYHRCIAQHQSTVRSNPWYREANQ